VDGSISFRKAGNYDDGNNKEVNHSQYNKFNTGIGIAYKTSPLSSVRIDAIFDMAKNVGFPALPMDLWLSRAMITSASYRQLFKESLIRSWDTKIYYNTIEHYMDDTKRPENLVHMDMPGWSTTYGLVSSVSLKKEKYTSAIELNMYNNTSIAEMRMYPQDRKNRTMFAYSWPWVTTRFAGISMNNNWEISDKSRLSFGVSLGLNYNESKYVEFNWIFHPGAPQQKTRILPVYMQDISLRRTILVFL
jgi:iron complex outermembrane receptor protein